MLACAPVSTLSSPEVPSVSTPLLAAHAYGFSAAYSLEDPPTYNPRAGSTSVVANGMSVLTGVPEQQNLLVIGKPNAPMSLLSLAETTQAVEAYVRADAANDVLLTWFVDLTRALQGQGFVLTQTETDAVVQVIGGFKRAMLGHFHDGAMGQDLLLVADLFAGDWPSNVGISVLSATMSESHLSQPDAQVIVQMSMKVSEAGVYRATVSEQTEALTKHVKTGQQALAQDTWPDTIDAFLTTISERQSR